MSTGDGLDARIVVKRGALHLDVALRVRPDETVALLGPNGAGKSTTLHTLAGLLPLFHGNITLNGRSLDDPRSGTFVASRHRGIGVVFQDYLLFEHLSVGDNVAFPLVARGVSRRAARRRISGLLERFELSSISGHKPREISGGQAQRAALARALASEPDMLLLDEPFAALDVQARARTRSKLGTELGSFGGPKVLITHDPVDAFMLAQRILVLEKGRLVQAGSADELRRHPASGFVAAFAGTNVFRGTCRNGSVQLHGQRHSLQVANQAITGEVVLRIQPSAVALHRSEPGGSPRNMWSTTIESSEPLAETVRLSLSAPLPLVVDVTPAAAAALDLKPLTPVWVSIKATEIEVLAA